MCDTAGMDPDTLRFLTADEVAQFDALGFVVRRGALSPAEVGSAAGALESVCADFLGRPPGGADVVWESHFVERSAALTDLIADDRIYLAVCDLLGKDVLWSGSEGMWGFDDSLADHDWHADGGWLPEQMTPYRLKVMLYLDPLRRDTGALRIIPGSHRALLHESLLPFNQASLPGGSLRYFGQRGQDLPAYAIETDPGDVVFFNNWLFHSVYGKVPPRRSIILKFVTMPRNDRHRAALRRESSIRADNRALALRPDPRLRRLAGRLPAFAGADAPPPDTPSPAA